MKVDITLFSEKRQGALIRAGPFIRIYTIFDIYTKTEEVEKRIENKVSL